MTSPYAAVRSTFPLAPVSVALPRPGNCAWVEPLKGLALLWIFLNHITESLFGPPYFGNPDQNWPVLSVRLAQILPSSASLGSILFALLKDFGWLGDQGVTLFLVVSGFGLTWGQLGRSSPPDWLAFYRRRLRRIYPLWIAAHLCLLLPPAFFALHISVLDSALWLSLLGIRITPRQLYYGYSSWWYIPLLLQLYLVFPLIWIATRSRQIRFRMAGLILSALAIRTCGLLYFQGYLDAWSRGAVFLARLPEFLLGVLLAQILFRFDLATLSKLVRLALGAASLLILAVALWCSLSKVGMGFTPFLFGAGLLGVYLPFFAPTKLSSLPPLGWLGRHSLALLLVHQLWLRLS